jgi:hypothetical protein
MGSDDVTDIISVSVVLVKGDNETDCSSVVNEETN